MRNLFILLLLSISTVYASSCCTKQSCYNYYEIRLSGFNESEVNVVYVITAESDSVWTQVKASKDGSYYYIPNFTVSEDSPPVTYTIPAAGKVYTLSDFSFDKLECNECAIGKDLYLQFSGCRVNGVEKGGNIITLEK